MIEEQQVTSKSLPTENECNSLDRKMKWRNKEKREEKDFE